MTHVVSFPSERTAVKKTIQASVADAPSTRLFMAPVVSHRFPFLQPRPYTEYMNNRGSETRDATGQSRVARDTRTVWSRFAAVRPNTCPAWSTWKVLTDVLVNICRSRAILADRSGKASRAHSQHVGSWTRHPASGVRATCPNVESPWSAWPAHCFMTPGTQPASQRRSLMAALAGIHPH